MSRVEVDQNAPVDQATVVHTDGRRARRDRNRDAVVDAYLDIVNDGHLEPSVAEVAERSGVSHRSVFRYFADREALVQAGIERQLRRAEPLLTLTVTPDMPLGTRISGFAAQRVKVLERIGPVGRLARLRVDQYEQLAVIVDQARSYFRNQIKQTFAPELDVMDDTRAADVVAAIDVLTSVEAFDLLRRVQGMSLVRITRLFEASITSLLR